MNSLNGCSKMMMMMMIDSARKLLTVVCKDNPPESFRGCFLLLLSFSFSLLSSFSSFFFELFLGGLLLFGFHLFFLFGLYFMSTKLFSFFQVGLGGHLRIGHGLTLSFVVVVVLFIGESTQ
mmetsp:Transcript_98716/g.284870  ORF Transcript_98716/g.284870 Transcript_98716/m.284870 type:complete len:121 (+) Transcript_98716:96-458(+)